MQRQTIVLRLTQQFLLLVQRLRAAYDSLVSRHWPRYVQGARSARVHGISHRVAAGDSTIEALRRTLSLALATRAGNLRQLLVTTSVL